MVYGDGWHHGVIGIVASRLLEAYEKPVVVISKDDNGFAVGSARSMKGFNIFKCFESCRDILVNSADMSARADLQSRARISPSSTA